MCFGSCGFVVPRIPSHVAPGGRVPKRNWRVLWTAREEQRPLSPPKAVPVTDGVMREGPRGLPSGPALRPLPSSCAGCSLPGAAQRPPSQLLLWVSRSPVVCR